MARRGTKLKTMYMNDELAAAFERVHAHYGKGAYSESEVLADLVRKKDEAIANGTTRRYEVAGLREDVAALTEQQKKIVEYLEILVEQMNHEHDTDHA